MGLSNEPNRSLSDRGGRDDGPMLGGDGDTLTAHDPAIAVSAVVVNWNGRTHLETCLASLLGQSLAGIEVILVDNGSTDGSLELVEERFGDAVRLVSNGSNLGYGQALNVGIRAARGRYLLALNNDTELAPGCVAALVEAADRHPSTGSFAPKILSFEDRGRIDSVGLLLYPDGIARGRGRLEKDFGQYDGEDEVLIASGCAMLLRRAMLADAGVFDQDFFAYCEDTDLGLRARLRGWRCRAVPAAVVYHKYSAATSAYSPLKAFLVERNRFWVALKCLPAPLLIASPLFTLLRLGAQAWGALSGRGAAGRFARRESPLALAGILARALVAGASGIPATLHKRRAIQSARRVTALDAVAWFGRHGMGVREIALRD
jgi:GT2 family glycosyltransferase